MPNQTSYDRINTNMIARINTFYSTRLNDEVVEAMVEDLERFSDHILKESFKVIRSTCKRIPSLAEVIEICQKQADRIPSKPAIQEIQNKGWHISGSAKAEDVDPNAVREIFNTAEGKLSLELGVGASLMVEYERTGRKQFEESWVRKQHKCMIEAVAMLESNRKAATYHALSSLHGSITAREKRLYDRFYKLGLQAA